VKLSALLILVAILSPAALAATVTVTITGTTGEIRVGEGPIFGHKSYTVIPPGELFQLTYTFDEGKGKQTVSEVRDGTIAQSQIEYTTLSSSEASATLQIGSGFWEFGAAAHAEVVLKTSAGGQSEQFTYTASPSNRVSAHIVPGKSCYWPKSGDWRASFISSPLDGSTASFSADNDRVSAKGSLVPQTIVVTGVDIDGQWLRSTTSPGGDTKWQLAHASPRGGYIVEQVTRTIRGAKADGSALSPSLVRYWQAWPVSAGSDAPADPVDNFLNWVMPGSTGEDNISAIARFYEGLQLPAGFARDSTPYAGGRLASTVDPNLSTTDATLPVLTNLTALFGTARGAQATR
jgi:hypothetical protein